MPRITYSERDSSLILFYSKFFPTPPGPACPLVLIFQSTYMPPFGTWKGSKSSLLSMLEVTLASECRTDLEPESVTYLWSSRCLGTWSCLCGPGLHLLAVLGFSPTHGLGLVQFSRPLPLGLCFSGSQCHSYSHVSYCSSRLFFFLTNCFVLILQR